MFEYDGDEWMIAEDPMLSVVTVVYTCIECWTVQEPRMTRGLVEQSCCLWDPYSESNREMERMKAEGRRIRQAGEWKRMDAK